MLYWYSSCGCFAILSAVRSLAVLTVCLFCMPSSDRLLPWTIQLYCVLCISNASSLPLSDKLRSAAILAITKKNIQCIYTNDQGINQLETDTYTATMQNEIYYSFLLKANLSSSLLILARLSNISSGPLLSALTTAQTNTNRKRNQMNATNP